MTQSAEQKLRELTSLLCTEPGQDPVERAKALTRERPKCSATGCRSRLSWCRDGGEWPSEKRDNAVAIRCLDCGSVLCPHHAQLHFDESVAAGRKREQEDVAALRNALRGFLRRSGREGVLDYQLLTAFDSAEKSLRAALAASDYASLQAENAVLRVARDELLDTKATFQIDVESLRAALAEKDQLLEKAREQIAMRGDSELQRSLSELKIFERPAKALLKSRWWLKVRSAPARGYLAVGESPASAYIDAVSRHPDLGDVKDLSEIDFKIIDRNFSFRPIPANSLKNSSRRTNLTDELEGRTKAT